MMGNNRKLCYLLITVFILIVGSSYVTAEGVYPTVSPNMRMYHHFNNNSSIGENSTKAVDISANKNNLSIKNNPSFNTTGGILGNGNYNLDGINQYMDELSINTNTNITTKLTLQFFVKVQKLGVKQAFAGRSFSSTRFQYGCYLNTDNTICCHANNKSNTLATICSTGFTLPINEYHFVSFTYDSTATTNNIKLYVDGRQRSQQSSAINGLSNSNSGITVGRWGATSSNYLNGSVEELILYNKTLTAAEIWADYVTYSGCIIPYEGIQINSNTTLCSGIYNLNGSTNGAIIIGENATLDGNGSTLIGNYSQSPSLILRGIIINSQATLKNINIENYYHGVLSNNYNYINQQIINNNFSLNKYSILIQNGFSNSSITNNTFIKPYADGIYIDGNQTNITISGNYFINATAFGITIDSGQNNLIYNNTFLVNNANGGIRIYDNNTNITNNIFEASGLKFSEAIRIERGSSYLLIKENLMSKSQYNIYMLGLNISRNISIINNTFFNGDQGSVISNCINCLFVNNTVRNITQSYDGYNVGLKIIDSEHIDVIGNNFTEIGTEGVTSQGSENIRIINNSFDFIPNNQRVLYLAADSFEARCAVQSTKRYKGFFNRYGNINLTILDNFFDSDTPCYIYLENQTGLNHDLVNFNYVSFDPNLTFAGLYEFYIPNYFNNFTRYTPAEGLKNNFRISSGSGSTSFHLEYYIFKEYLRLYNINLTATYKPILKNMSNALIYNLNGSVYGSSNVNNNDGSINITLPSLNSVYALNNFNLTEGVTRQYSPLWFSSSTESVKKIASNITDTLTVPVIVDATCDSSTTLYYVSHTGTYSSSFDTGAFTCIGGNQIAVNLSGIETASGSNTLIILNSPLNNTFLNLTAINTTVNITYPWYFDKMIVTNSSIYVENLSSSNPLQTGITKKLTFNFTEANKNYTGIDFPYVSASSSSQKLITSSLSSPVTITGTFDVSTCDTTFAYYSNTEVYQTITVISCNDNTATITFIASPGVTTLMLLDNYIDDTNDGINNVKTTVYVVFGLISIMILAAISMLIINMLNSNMDFTAIITMLILAIGAAIVLIIGYIIISSVSNVLVS